MSCPTVTTIIDPDQCIGNSLSIINENFTNLKEGICNNIDRIDFLEGEVNSLTNNVNSLSSIVVPGVAKAWVKFDGSRNEQGLFTPLGFRYTYGKYNVEGVDEYFDENENLVEGFYRIDFVENLFSETDYLILGTSSESKIGNLYTWVQPVELTDSYAIIKVANSAGQATSARHISVVFFK